MNLTRRGLLTGLVAFATAPAIVRAESLMPIKFVTPEITFALTNPSGNSLLTINLITREAVRLFVNSNAFIKSIDEQYDCGFATNQARIGSTLRIKLPNAFAIVQGHQFA